MIFQSPFLEHVLQRQQSYLLQLCMRRFMETCYGFVIVLVISLPWHGRISDMGLPWQRHGIPPDMRWVGGVLEARTE